MENFFEYKPTVVGVIIDLNDFINLDRVKKALIGLAQTFTAVTEDKLFVYRGVNALELRRWVGESVADVAGYAEKDWVNPCFAITQTVFALSVIDPEYSNKHIFYFTDRGTVHRPSQVRQAMAAEQSLHSGCQFHIINMGRHSESLAETVSSHPRADYGCFGRDVTTELLLGLTHAKDIEPQQQQPSETAPDQMDPLEG